VIRPSESENITADSKVKFISDNLLMLTKLSGNLLIYNYMTGEKVRKLKDFDLHCLSIDRRFLILLNSDYCKQKRIAFVDMIHFNLFNLDETLSDMPFSKENIKKLFCENGYFVSLEDNKIYVFDYNASELE
jgi:hypothetical protein